MAELIFSNTISILIAVIASSGFWSFMQSRKSKKDASTELLLALAQDRITFLGMGYIDRGYLTKEEHDNLLSMYEPYAKKGGNGSAKKVVDDCNRLPLCKPVHFGADNDTK